jgi:hypothetical protein
VGKTEDVGAIIMRKVATKAAAAAKKALIEVVERELPEGENPRNAARQIGAMITASSMLYGSMVDTVASEGDQVQALLVAGMLQHFVAEGLCQVSDLAGQAGGVLVAKV